jgi:hypothetical protein
MPASPVVHSVPVLSVDCQVRSFLLVDNDEENLVAMKQALRSLRSRGGYRIFGQGRIGENSA